MVLQRPFCRMQYKFVLLLFDAFSLLFGLGYAIKLSLGPPLMVRKNQHAPISALYLGEGNNSEHIEVAWTLKEVFHKNGQVTTKAIVIYKNKALYILDEELLPRALYKNGMQQASSWGKKITAENFVDNSLQLDHGIVVKKDEAGNCIAKKTLKVQSPVDIYTGIQPILQGPAGIYNGNLYIMAQQKSSGLRKVFQVEFSDPALVQLFMENVCNVEIEEVEYNAGPYHVAADEILSEMNPVPNDHYDEPMRKRSRRI